jgi:cellulose synthase operon protein YhjQ
MSEKPQEPEEGSMPEEVVRLYSQANLPGTRYWDFSASRKQVQGQFRRRIEREHAERAGVERPAPSTRPAIEQIRSSQFQSGLTQKSASAPVVRSVAAVPELSAVRRPSMPAHTESPSTRWYALQSVFAPVPATVQLPVAPPISPVPRPPVMAVFSLVGGVGKTSLVATLGRALSALGEQVFLVDTTSGGLLPFYFGSRECKPGMVRTFAPPTFPPSAAGRGENQVPVQLLNLEAERFPRYEGGQDLLLGKLLQDGRAASRILVDVATGGREVNERLLALQPTVLVPVLPDMNSVASLHSLESLLGALANAADSKVFYLLNQFDSSSTLHCDMRAILQQRLGDRLLPFVVRSSPAFNEALAEGMTVMDYAPESAVADDYRNIAAWVTRLKPPAAAPGSHGARWRER